MNLFEEEINETTNLLPYDGVVNYYGNIFSNEEAHYFFNQLLSTLSWSFDQTTLYGKTYVTKRKVAWYGDRSFIYKYSNHLKTALPWTDDLLRIKSIIEQRLGETFNSCLINLYHNGEEGMSWHSDNETELKKNGTIASLSFGASRKFYFKHKNTKAKVECLLSNGSLLTMKDETQTHWLHSLPKSKKINEARINLTFRTIITSSLEEI